MTQIIELPGRLAQSVVCQIGNLTSPRGHEFKPQSDHISQSDHIPFIEIGNETIYMTVLSVPLIQVGQ